MQKQKLAIVNVFFPPQEIGGATRVVADQVDVLLQDYKDQFELVVFTTEAEQAEPYHQLTVYPYHGIPVYKANCIFREHMDWHPRDPAMGKLFDKFLSYEQPDLIHFHCVQRLTGSIIEAAIEHSIPYWITVHDAWWISDYQFLVDDEGVVYPEGHPDPYGNIPLPKGISLEDSMERRFYFKELLHKAHGVLTVSEGFADIYRKNGVMQIQVNKNGLSNKTNWQPKSTDSTNRVVCAHIGGMAEHKGYPLFKQAIETVQPKNIEVLVVDLGQPEGYCHHTYWETVPVTIMGRISKANIVALYQQLDVLFAPSIWPESFGLVTREATACGCWVVASDLGGIGEDIDEGKNGFKIKAGSLGALVKVIKMLDKRFKQFKKTPLETQSIRYVDEQVAELVKLIRIN